MSQDVKKYLNEEQQKLFDQDKQYFQYCQDASRDFRNSVEDVFKLWTGYVDPAEQPFKSSKRLPKARRAVNTQTAFLVAKEPTFSVAPKGDDDYIKADMLRILLQEQAKRTDVLDLKRQVKLGVKSAILYGVGLWKVSWKTLINEKNEVVHDDPCLENRQVLDVMVDPFISTFEGQTKVIDVFVPTLEELRRNKAYKIPEDVKPTYTNNTSVNFDSARLDQYSMANKSTASADVIGKIKVWEVWTNTKVRTWGDPEGNVFLMREIDNPYGFIPYVKMDYEYEPNPNYFYSTGAIAPSLKINKGIDEMVNAITDNIRISMHSMFLRRRDSKVDPRQFIFRPGGFIDVEDLNNDVKQLETPDRTGAAYKLLQMYNGEWNAGTSVQPLRMGIGGEADSATEATLQQDNADVMTNSIKENMEAAIKQIGIMVAKLNVKNMQRSLSIRIFDLGLINKVHKMATARRFMPDQVQELQQTGAIAGYSFTPEEEQQIYQNDGYLPGVDLSREEIERIKKFGAVIEFSKKWIDVDSDIDVEADSTMTKNSAVLAKQIGDMVQIAMQFPDGMKRLDIDEYIETMASLKGIPMLRKILKDADSPDMNPQNAPQVHQIPQDMQGAQAPQPPRPDQLNTPQAMMQSVQQANQPVRV